MAHNQDRRKRVVILGAGSSGLAVGWGLLKRPEYEVTILERSSGIGGLSTTIEKDGVRFDIGPHRLSPQLPGVVEKIRDLLGDDLLELENEHGVFFSSMLYRYPPGLVDLLRPVSFWHTLRFGMSWISGRLASSVDLLIHGDREHSFEEILIHSFGRRFCEAVIFPMIMKVWGTRDLHADFARLRFETPTMTNVFRRLMRWKGHPGNRYFYYPRKGYGQIFDTLGQVLRQGGQNIELDVSICSITAETLNGPFVVSYRLGDELRAIAADILVSSISNRELLCYLSLSGLVDAVLSEGTAFDSRTLRLGVMVVRDFRLPSRIIIFPEERFMFNRISDMSLFADLGYPANCSVILIDVICDKKSEYESLPDDMFNQCLTDSVLSLEWFCNEDIEKMFSIKIPDAYPVLNQARYGAQETLDSFFEKSRIILCGREASSDYNNAHNAIGKGLLTAQFIMGEVDGEKFRSLSRLLGRLPIQD